MVNGVVSNVAGVISGVPQGSILGQLLFIMYIDKLDLSPGTTLVIYVDDIFLYKHINTLPDFTWLQNAQYLTLNPAKCKAMLISNKKSYAPLSITISQILIESVKKFKHLGVLLTYNLLWSSHINSICMIYRHFYKFCNDSQTATALFVFCKTSP